MPAIAQTRDSGPGATSRMMLATAQAAKRLTVWFAMLNVCMNHG